MTPRVLVPVLLVLLAPLALAKGGDLRDAAGDGNPDVLGASWADGANAAELALSVDVAAADSTEVRAFWGRGTAGQPGPDEWYLVSVAAGKTAVVAGHGSGGDVPAGTNWTAGVLTVTFTRVEPSQGACSVVAAVVGTGSATGFARTDAVPDAVQSPEAIWPEAGACPVQDGRPAVSGPSDAKDSPLVPVGLLAAGLLALVLRRR